MAVQHDAIVDAERHEAKHADAATAGQVLKANGGGVTSFVTPSTLTNIVYTQVLEGIDTTAQTPGAPDVPLQVTFGGATSNADITLSALGLITFNTAGVYKISIHLHFGRAAAAGITNFLARLLVNGTAISPTYYVVVENEEAVIPFDMEFTRAFSATNTLALQIMQDSAGLSAGGLVTFNPTAAGWADVPSAYVRIQKMAGAA
jgi:hypothetical protein